MARKHITQFNLAESGMLHGFMRAHAGKVWSSRVHFMDRAAERSFTLQDARCAIACGKVVELHNERGEWRTLVRNRQGTCAVLALETLEVVTVYYNAPDDTHLTLNHALYHGANSIDAVQIVKSLNRR